MTLDLFDQIYFEVADYAPAARLTRRLGRERSTALLGEDPYVIVTGFSPGSADLAALLRQVETFVEAESLCAIRFLLDDRIYVLEAGNADWDKHPWREPVEANESPQAA
jgi:hypothetical protein